MVENQLLGLPEKNSLILTLTLKCLLFAHFSVVFIVRESLLCKCSFCAGNSWLMASPGMGRSKGLRRCEQALVLYRTYPVPAQDQLLRQAQFQHHTPAALSSRLFFLLFQPQLCWCASSSMLWCAGVALGNVEGEDGYWCWLILISSCLVWLQVPDRWEIAEEMGLGDTMGHYHLSVTVHPNVSYAVLMSYYAKELR